MNRTSRLLVLSLIVLGICRVEPASAQQSYLATLDGAQQVPPVATPGSGTGSFVIEYFDVFPYLLFDIEYQGLIGTEISSHIHGPAQPGQNGSVIYVLPVGSVKSGMVGPLTPRLMVDLNAGLWYVNVHTDAYTTGEIRGQILAPVSTRELSWGAIKEIYRVEP